MRDKKQRIARLEQLSSISKVEYCFHWPGDEEQCNCGKDKRIIFTWSDDDEKLQDTS